jgi:hypothetical protein
MAVTAAMHHLIPQKLRSNDDPSNDNSNAAQSGRQSSHSPRHEDHDDMMAHEEEMNFISQWEEEKRPLSPSQITMEPAQKKVGHSSHHLRLDDFELVKTLGTGARIVFPG